nr:hypothetical protein [Tanacetum cinerariifolium]
MKSRTLLSLLWKIRSWKKLFLCGKKSPEKPTVELPREIIESDVLPRLDAVEFPREIIESKVLPRLHVAVELPHEIIESEVLPRLHPTVELLHEIIEWEILPRLPAKSLGGKSTRIQVLFPMMESISSFTASFQNNES